MELEQFNRLTNAETLIRLGDAMGAGLLGGVLGGVLVLAGGDALGPLADADLAGGP